MQTWWNELLDLIIHVLAVAICVHCCPLTSTTLRSVTVRAIMVQWSTTYLSIAIATRSRPFQGQGTRIVVFHFNLIINLEFKTLFQQLQYHFQQLIHYISLMVIILKIYLFRG